MKKILYISQYFPPETGAGATRSEAMVKFLKESGWDIEVISELPNYPTGNIYPGYRNVFHQQDKIHSVKINRVWVWANSRRSLREQIGIFSTFLFSSVAFALRNKQDVELVYASSPPIFAGLAGALIARILKAKFVLEIRDIWPDAAVDVGQITTSSSFYHIGHRIERWLYNKADVIIPVTHRSKEIIQSRVINTPIEVVSNGVDLSHFRRIEHPEKVIDETYDSSKFRVGYVGSLGVIHDMETFVKAAKICEEDERIEFVIIGDGRSRYKLEEAIKKINPKNLTWLGLKEHSKIPAYISTFDIAVNPVHKGKIFESIMTVKFYEYLACEVPVISLANGLMSEEGDKSGAAITIDPGNFQKLALVIKELKEQPEKLSKMSKLGRSYILNNYSRKVLAEKLSSILSKI